MNNNMWENLRQRHPRFTALVDMLTTTKFQEEYCPTQQSWWFMTKDRRYQAQVNWPTYTVKIWRRR